MKLKLTKAWYEERAKAEEKCSFVAAGASLRSIEDDLPGKRTRPKSTKKAANKSSTIQEKARRRAK